MLNAVLLALLVWPGIQHLLVRTVEVNPWKLGGLSMYCTPNSTQVEFWDVSSEPPRQIVPDVLSTDLVQEVDRFARSRAAVGKLLPPTRIAKSVMEETPSVSRLKVRIGVRRIEAASTHLRTRWTAYVFRRTEQPIAATRESATGRVQ